MRTFVLKFPRRFPWIGETSRLSIGARLGKLNGQLGETVPHFRSVPQDARWHLTEVVSVASDPGLLPQQGTGSVEEWTERSALRAYGSLDWKQIQREETRPKKEGTPFTWHDYVMYVEKGLARMFDKPLGWSRWYARHPLSGNQRMFAATCAAEIWDARPARELFLAEIHPRYAIQVYGVAWRWNLWSRGYGSPRSPNAVFMNEALRKGWWPSLIQKWIRAGLPGTSIVPGWRIAKNRVRVTTSLARALFRLAKQDDLSCCHPPNLGKWGGFAQKYVRGHKTFLAMVGSMHLHREDTRWSRAILLDTFIQQYRRPKYELVRDWASPYLQWRCYGFAARWRCKTPLPGDPSGLKGLKSLISPGTGNLGDELLTAIGNLSMVFGRNAARWIRETGLSMHDAGQINVPAHPQTLGDYLISHLKTAREQTQARRDEVNILARCWEPDFASMGWAGAVTAALEQSYHCARAVAVVAGELRMSSEDATQYEEWLAQCPVKTAESIPQVKVRGKELGLQGNWLFEKLDFDDIRGPVLGLYTDCCQHPGHQQGGQCAQSGWESPWDAFVVVHYNGRIVAQSWVWRTQDTLVFDNIEVLSGAYREAVLDLYKEAARRFLGRLGIRAVHVGTGYDDVGVEDLPAVNPVQPLEYTGYRDSRAQRLLGRIQ